MDQTAVMIATEDRELMGVIAVLAAMALAVLDAGAINVALPLLAASLGASPAGAILAVTAYQLAIVVGLLPCAHLAESIGYRRLFVTGIVLFSAAALGSAIAPSLQFLIAVRFAQGLGSSAIMALGVALLRNSLGPTRLAKAIGWNALTVAVCSAAGPTIGAAILSLADWRWVFLTGLPLAALSLIAARSLPTVAPTRLNSDWVGMALYPASIALLFAAWRYASAMSFTAIVMAGIGMVFAFILVRRDLTRAAPFLPLDLIARRPIQIAAAASISCFISQSLGIIVLPFHLLGLLHQAPLAAGFLITCWPLSVAFTSAIANRFLGSVNNSVQCLAGGIILTLGLFAAAFATVHESLLPLAIATSLCGIGFGLFQLANNQTLFLSASEHRAAAAGGIQGTARLSGQTAGTVIASLVFASIPHTIAPEVGFVIGSGFALAAALVSSLGIREGHRVAANDVP